VTLTTPVSGRFVTDWLGHAMINPPTKFEVPNLTRYGNMKGVAKCRQCASRSLGVTQALSLSAMSPFDTARTTSCSSLIEIIRLSCAVYDI